MVNLPGTARLLPLTRRGLVCQAAPALGTGMLSAALACRGAIPEPPAGRRDVRELLLAVPSLGLRLPDGQIDDQPPADWREAVAEVNDQARERTERTAPFRLKLVGLPHAGGPDHSAADDLEAMLAAQPPDLAGLVSPSWLPKIVERALVQPLDVLFQTTRVLPRDTYPEAVLNAVRLRGQIFALPVEAAPVVLWFDPRLFDAQSAPYPDSSWTWERLGEAAAALTLDRDGDGELDQWGLRANVMEDLLIWQAGGEIVSPDGRQALLRQEATLRAARFLDDLYHRYRALPPPLASGESVLMGGKLGIAILGGRPRQIAMAYSPAPSRRYSPVAPLRLAEVPRGRVRATKVRVSQAILLTRKTTDPLLAFQAAAAVLQRLEARGYLSGRQVQPARPGTETVIDQESRLAVARSFAYARTLPLDLERAVASVLGAKLVMPLRDGTATPEQAVEAAALALEPLIAQAR